jgi:hypothetical protein
MDQRELFLLVYRANESYLIERARICQNAVMSEEDCIQELCLHLLEKIRNYRYLDDPTYNHVGWAKKVIRDKSIDMIRFWTRRTDSSWYAEKVEDYEHLITSPVLPVIEEDLFYAVVNTAKRRERELPGITRFSTEALRPSIEIWEAYEEYCSKLGRRSKLHYDKYCIPPKVLVQLLGIPLSKLLKYQKELMRIVRLVGLGKKQLDLVAIRLGLGK